MIGIARNYNALATAFYNFYRRFGPNYWSTPYEAYLLNISRVYFPKIAYQNNFEPEYTRTSYNAYLALALIAATLVAARQTVAEEERNNTGHI
jgi:hypothetical protein